MGIKYECSGCHGKFESPDDWTQEDAIRESTRVFGTLPDNIKPVCDSCFQRILLIADPSKLPGLPGGSTSQH